MNVWTRLVAFVLAGIAAIASVGIAWTVMDDWHEPVGMVAIVQPAGPTRQPVGGAPDGQINRQVATILSRPLFNADRRPPASSASSLAGLPRLTGIVISDAEKVAIFSAPAGGRTTVASEGGRVGQYDIRAIDAAGVIVDGPEGVRTVRPLFDPNPPATPKTAPPLKPPPSVTARRP